MCGFRSLFWVQTNLLHWLSHFAVKRSSRTWYTVPKENFSKFCEECSGRVKGHVPLSQGGMLFEWTFSTLFKVVGLLQLRMNEIWLLGFLLSVGMFMTLADCLCFSLPWNWFIQTKNRIKFSKNRTESIFRKPTAHSPDQITHRVLSAPSDELWSNAETMNVLQK